MLSLIFYPQIIWSDFNKCSRFSENKSEVMEVLGIPDPKDGPADAKDTAEVTNLEQERFFVVVKFFNP
jgi:hypothetical protein